MFPFAPKISGWRPIQATPSRDDVRLHQLEAFQRTTFDRLDRLERALLAQQRRVEMKITVGLLLASFLFVPALGLAQPRADYPQPRVTHDGAKMRTEIITVFPPPTQPAPGQTIILRSRPDGTTRVTVCSWIQGVGLLCTGGQ